MARPDFRTAARGTASAVLAISALAGCNTDEAATGIRPFAMDEAKAAAAVSSWRAMMPGQYIVQFDDDVADVPGLAKQVVASVGGRLGFTYTAAIKGFSTSMSAAAASALAKNPRIKLVEADQVAQASGLQLTPPSWGLDRIDQRAMPLDATFDEANGGAGVNVYIIDTGVRVTHADFAGRAFSAFTSINDGRGTSDCYGHGTHVAGIAGGSWTGVAKLVRIHAVRVLQCDGSGTYSSIIAGIDWVTKNRVLPAVANMSLSGSTSSTMNQAVQNSIRAGVVYTVAAGNQGTDACSRSPASVPEALTVGSTFWGDAMVNLSNYGRCLDLFAPGSAILSTMHTSDTAHASMGGTSMAAPHVAGAAALYLSANPSASPAEVVAAIAGNATPGVITNIGAGSPNLLLYTGFIGGSSAPPPSLPDTTTVPDTTNAPDPTAPDTPPTASFTSSCGKQPCRFDGRGSTDDRGIASFTWQFGDASPALSGPLPMVSHAYKTKGTYDVTLTVTDSAGQTATSTRRIKIAKP